MRIELKVNEMFLSIDGEVNNQHQGKPSFFIRLAKCNLRCVYCDTSHSWTDKGSKLYSVDDLLQMVLASEAEKVTITGGEPLLQYAQLLPLLESLHRHDIFTSIETNGSVLPEDLYRSDFVYYIWDCKLPSSGQMDRMCDAVFVSGVAAEDWVKFVIQDDNDFKVALQIIKRYHLEMSNIAFSPNLSKYSCKRLMDMMQKYKILFPIISIQLHKLMEMR